MVFISRKIIKGKKRYYMEKSVRLPNSKVKKFSVYLKDYGQGKKSKEIAGLKELLNAKIHEELTEFAAKYYKIVSPNIK